MAKKKAKTRRVLVTTEGDKYIITGENGKYYFCEGDTRFRKAAHRGKVQTEEVPQEEETEG